MDFKYSYTLKKLKLYIWACWLVLISACSITGLNIYHKTPKRAFKYPVFTLKDTLRGQLNHYRSCYDVYFYNLNVDIEFKTKTISGNVDIYFNTIKNFDTLQIDLYQNISLDSILCENSKLPFYRKYDAVFVLMGHQVIAAEKMKISVYYHGKPKIAAKPPWEGGFVWSKDKNGKPWIGVACEQEGACLWWPVKDHLSDKPDSMMLNFTIPSGLMCVSNGHLIDSVPNNRKTIFRWKVTYPINSYNATFYIGDFRHFTIPYKSLDTTFNLDFYVLPYNLDKAREHFAQTTAILQYYESIYGPYPWPRDGYKLIESPYQGMENQTAIAYGNGYKNLANLFDHIILHESAHEWWGNSVNVPDYAEIWIHEGFASYSEALYAEHIYGLKIYLNLIRFYSYIIQNKKPVIGPHDVNYWDYKDGDVYMKGALMLHTLRNTLSNDSLFFDIIKSFYNLNKYKTVVTQNFVDMVNQKTRKDYTWFFMQYLYDRKCPELIWQFSNNKDKNKNELSYKWSNVASDFSIPVKIQNDSTTTIIWPTLKLQKIDLPPENSTIKLNVDESYISLKRRYHIK